MNKKLLIGGVGLAILGIVGYLVWQNFQPEEQAITTASGQVITLPERMAEINGTVQRIEGNEVVVNRVISSLTAEEQAAKRAERQAMTVEERQALRGQETETAQTEEVTVIIPVGVPIVITSGDATGTMKEAGIADIKVGGNLSIWQTSAGAVEIVKIKGV